MSHWINQLDTWLKPNEPFMLAAVCDITGATPDASRGVLLLCGERAASNIINERRRQAVVNDAKYALQASNTGVRSAIRWVRYCQRKTAVAASSINTLTQALT
jgi:hypothetical protein